MPSFADHPMLSGIYEPVVDDEIIVAQLRDERLKNVLDAEAALEVGVIDEVPQDGKQVDELGFEIDELRLKLGHCLL